MKHADQQRIWDEEHANPTVLMPMDEERPSGAIEPFYEYMQSLPEADSYQTGFEIGCGKGRNVNWLANKGLDVTGLDFSPNAIAEAQKRAKAQHLSSAHFIVHDVINRLPFADASCDFAIDCYASTDIEKIAGRQNARAEITRTLRLGGLYLLCVMASDSEFHEQMAQKYPGDEPGSFHHPENGKFEKAFSDDEISDNFIGQEFTVAKREIYERQTEFAGQAYNTRMHLLIMRKN